MALSGTLADIGVVELIQFPSNGRKTGELIVVGNDDEARLYYVDGALVHITVGDRAGMEGLVEVVSWTTGEFEFRMGVENDHRTIELDLHRALMLALKTRDERAEKARQSEERGAGKGSRSPIDKATAFLKDLVSSYEAVSGAYLLSDDGSILARSDSGSAMTNKELEETLALIVSLYDTYKRSQLARVFLDDDEGILHAARLTKGGIAVLAAYKEASMGVVSMLMNKLISGMMRIR